MLDQETDSTETSSQTNISAASPSKQQDKAKNQIKDWKDLSKSNTRR